MRRLLLISFSIGRFWVVPIVTVQSFQPSWSRIPWKPDASFRRQSLQATTVTSDDEAYSKASILNADEISTSQIVEIEPDMQAFSSAYTTVFQELPYLECIPTFGSIPSDLIGSYFRVGPAMFSAGSIVPPRTSIVQPKQPPVPDGTDPDRMVLHPFDGDGAILGITFTSDDNKAIARYRFIRTAGFTNERKKGRRLYNAMDSTRIVGGTGGLGNDLPLPVFRHHLQPGLNKNRKNTSNTRAVFWGNRLLTLFEGSQPFKLDSLALSTEGRSRLGGAIRRDTDPFGAKLSYDAHRNHALSYSVDPGAMKSRLTVFEFDAQFKLVENGRTDHDLPGFSLINDFCTTENYAIFIQPNLQVNGMQFLIQKEPGKILSLDSSQSSTLHLIPRAHKAGDSLRSMRIPVIKDGASEANMQFCNAYETADQKIIIDAILSDATKDRRSNASPLNWPWGTTLAEYQSMSSQKSLWRFTVDLRQGTVQKQCLFRNQYSFGAVNPAVSSCPHRYIYMNVGGLGATVAPPQGLVKYDTVTMQQHDGWMPQVFEFCGEPMYAPRSSDGKDAAEDSGYILSVLYNGRRKESELLIFQANALSDGPTTRIPLGVAIPHGHYGCFSTQATMTAEEIDRRVKLADKMESRGNRWNEVKSDFSGLGLRLDDMEEYFGDWNPFD
jgi:all-trans-8'-apo-beta-carotenal 15,15'-oxygenase